MKKSEYDTTNFIKKKKRKNKKEKKGYVYSHARKIPVSAQNGLFGQRMTTFSEKKKDTF